jgi:hypothetical protein
VLVAPLYDRLLGMVLGLVASVERVAQPDTKTAIEDNPYLQTWVASVIRLHHKLCDSPQDQWSRGPRELITRTVTETWGDRTRSSIERVFALVVGVFCWCDQEEILAIWREVLSADCPEDAQAGIDVFTIILRSFLREPPGYTIWLPLKRKTTIAALRDFAPQALTELQLTKYSTSYQNGDVFLSSIAIACQLPWYSSACKLARRQKQPPESIAIIGSLLGAAFGSIAFQEDQRALKQMDEHQQTVAVAIAPLWTLLTGSGEERVLATVSLPIAFHP